MNEDRCPEGFHWVRSYKDKNGTRVDGHCARNPGNVGSRPSKEQVEKFVMDNFKDKNLTPLQMERTVNHFYYNPAEIPHISEYGTYETTDNHFIARTPGNHKGAYREGKILKYGKAYGMNGKYAYNKYLYREAKEKKKRAKAKRMK